MTLELVRPHRSISFVFFFSLSVPPSALPTSRFCQIDGCFCFCCCCFWQTSAVWRKIFTLRRNLLSRAERSASLFLHPNFSPTPLSFLLEPFSSSFLFNRFSILFLLISPFTRWHRLWKALVVAVAAQWSGPKLKWFSIQIPLESLWISFLK